MKKLIIQLCISIIFVGTVFSQTNTNNIDRVKNDTLKAFLKKFNSPILPTEFSNINDSISINKKYVKHFLDIKLEDNFGFEEFYYNMAIFEDNYISIIYNHYFSPGAFGINNYFVNIITMDYNGNIIDDEDIGCFCSDTNMGSNDYYASNIHAKIERGFIFIIRENIHATLFEEELENEEDSFEEITFDKYTITINTDGTISKE